MPPVSDIKEANPPHLASSDFLVNLAASLNVLSIPLAIFLLILILITCILFVTLVICMLQSCLKTRYVTKKKKKPIKSIYLDELPGGSETKETKYGTLDYTLEYSLERQELQIGVIQAMGLASRPGVDHVDAYVSVTLYRREEGRDKPVGSSQKTAVRQRSKQPTWNERFNYHLKKSDLKNTVVVFVAYDYDNIGQDMCIGRLEIPLTEGEYVGQVLENTGYLTIGQSYIEGNGELCVGLTFHPTVNRLDVTIFEARQVVLQSHKIKNYLDVEVELRHKRNLLNTFCTKKKDELINPYFNEKTSFSVTTDQIDKLRVVCVLRQSGRMRMRKTLGKIIIGSESQVTSGTKHWEEMLKGTSRMHVMWHTLTR